MLEETRCPECDGPMVSRANKATGQRFWGCKNFPKCKGTRNTDGEARRLPPVDDPGVFDDGAQSGYERARRNDRERWRS